MTPALLWGVILFIRSFIHTVLTNLGSLHSYSCLFHTEFTARVQPAAWSARQLLTVTVTDKTRKADPFWGREHCFIWLNVDHMWLDYSLMWELFPTSHSVEWLG